MLTQEMKNTLRTVRGDIKTLAERQKEIKKLLKTQKDNKDLTINIISSLDSERFSNKSKITALLIILADMRNKPRSQNCEGLDYLINYLKEYYAKLAS